MQRREFLTLIGAAAATPALWPGAVRAQERMRQLGVLMGFAESDPEGQAWLATFERALGELGWSKGRNLRLDYRYAGGVLERTQAFAKDLVAQQPDAIFAGNTPAVLALMRETRTIPVIFTNLSDPVDTGLVRNLARPGANVTGFTAFEYSLSGKWLEILKQVAPQITRVALLLNPDTAPYAQNYITALQAAGSVLKIVPSAAPVREIGEIDAVIAAQAREAGAGMIVMPTNFSNVNRTSIIAAMGRHRVPAIYPFRVMATEGGLVFYGADTIDLYRRAAAYVDRVLRGANPGELPVQQPTKFQLVINLKAAKELGLALSPGMLALADEVIE